MAEPLNYMKAVEFDKLPAAFKKAHGRVDNLRQCGWWLQPKYDGCFVKIEVNPFGSFEITSRTDEPVRSMAHIGEELADRCTATGLYGTFYGEAWHPTETFPVVSGMFRRHSPQPELVFMANDFVEPDREAPYSDRYATLQALIGRTHSPSVGVDPGLSYAVFCYRSGNWASHATTFAQNWVRNSGVVWGHYDGAILRDPAATYNPGLVKNGELIKVKPNIRLDLKVTAVQIQRGEKTGREVYTIAVEYQGVETVVGSGMPHKFEDAPKVGQIVEIEAMAVTGSGALREPRFIAIRHDKLQPDE